MEWESDGVDASDDGANSATTMPTHHTHIFAKQVSVEVPPRLCGVTKVLAHHSVHQQSHQFGVPPITVSLVCVCAKCGVDVSNGCHATHHATHTLLNPMSSQEAKKKADK